MFTHTHFFSSSGRCHSRFSLVLLGVCHTARVSCVIWMVSFAEMRQIHWQIAAQSTFNLACSNPSPGLPGHGFLLAYRIRQDSLLRTPGPWGWVCIRLPTPVSSMPAALALLLVSFCHGPLSMPSLLKYHFLTLSPGHLHPSFGQELKQTKAPQPGRTK